MRKPRFFYFDLGNVLLFFDHGRACRQVGELTKVPEARVREILYGQEIFERYESGQVDNRQVYDLFCEAADRRPDYQAFLNAAGDIFEVNALIKPVVAALAMAGERLGLLSNTNACHWQWFGSGRYGMIPNVFEQVILSFEVGAMKPHAAIFQAAAEKAGLPPEEIFFIDDTAGHVAAAQRLGFDAIQYTGVPDLAAALRERGVKINY